MVSPLRLKGYGGQAGVSVQVSGVSKQMTEDRKQKSERGLHLPVFIICLLSSDI
jgi:hypothetical protein